ncbi:hypothetical protein V8E51_003722 [Hyaloscypha variabilis]
MLSPTRKKAEAKGTFRSRDSKRLDDSNTITTKRSFQNLRQLFKLPARVLTPFSGSKKRDDQRGRALVVNQAEPKTHRLLGEISPTRARALPSNSNTAPDLRKLASRNASASVLSSPLRNISEPLPPPRFPQPDYSSRYTPSSLRSSVSAMKLITPPPNLSRYSVVTEMGFEVRCRSPTRHALTDVTRQVNSPQMHYRRQSLGLRNTSNSLNTVPYASRPTTATSQQNTPPRPVFANGKRASHRAERSLSVLNQENRRNTHGGVRPRTTTTREKVVTPREFRNSVSSLIQASSATTASTHPASPPKALFTTNPRYIYTAQPHTYWAGRFMSLHDQFHTQMLASAINSLDTRPPFKRPDSKLKKQKSKRSSPEDPERDSSSRNEEEAMRHDEVRRCKRVFYTLQSLCVTDEAKHSLWGFQLRFARSRKMEACLPDGGAMEDVKESSWMRLTHRKKIYGDLGETF